MSVTFSGPPTILPWVREHEDSSYPAARWIFSRTLTGDVSGGVILADCILEASLKRTARLFTIEEYFAHRGDNTADIGFIRMVGFDVDAPDSPDLMRHFTLTNVGTGSAFSGTPSTTRPLRLPFYHRPGADLTVSLQIETNSNTITYKVFLWGWLWEAEAYNTPSGPRKPW